MSYRMFTVDEPSEADEAAVTAAHDRVRAAANPMTVPAGPERQAAQREWDAAWRALDFADVSYFGMSDGQMRATRSAMGNLGMLTLQEAPAWPILPTLPRASRFVRTVRWLLGYGKETAAEQLDAETFETAWAEAAWRAVTEHEAQPVTGVPLHKLSGQDGWWVTPAQIGAALSAYDAASDQDRQKFGGTLPWFGRWIGWLRTAQHRGGFRVQ
ncbi:hypothetical protein F7Q99_36170 [Streptomyces kaniharaensis]|uniref:Uncharacterized protein n=1 Tax=Streptomyces kaniharaensis TaxID=212423 RepID=A0A6N7L3T7_9ACTN|nr:hypothetical protein [Streptomyces kaniharaensis]MQS17479.1 hypothetical protein [Streptomyces kaniharaensis]